MTKSDLPKRVHIKSGSYWHVRAEGKKRVWTKLCRVRDGMPAMYRALADLEQAELKSEMMPALIADWMLEVSSQHKPKTQANDLYQTNTIKEAFAEFRASQVRPSHIAEFLKAYKNRPRSYNAYRTMLRELMRYAEEKDYRAEGTNPVDSIKTAKTPPRTRYITDSELRRIKVGICYGDDGKRTRSGPMICCLVEMALLTGQRASDLLELEWGDISSKGILFRPGKTADSTAVAILVQWTPRLRKLVDRLKAFPQSGHRHVFCKLDGQAYTYSGASSAWKRGLKRAGLVNTQFRDLRAKALTDIDESHDIKAAQRLGGHSTQSQTAEYIRHKRAITAKAAK